MLIRHWEVIGWSLFFQLFPILVTFFTVFKGPFSILRKSQKSQTGEMPLENGEKGHWNVEKLEEKTSSYNFPVSYENLQICKSSCDALE